LFFPAGVVDGACHALMDHGKLPVPVAPRRTAPGCALFVRVGSGSGRTLVDTVIGRERRDDLNKYIQGVDTPEARQRLKRKQISGVKSLRLAIAVPPGRENSWRRRQVGSRPDTRAGRAPAFDTARVRNPHRIVAVVCRAP